MMWHTDGGRCWCSHGVGGVSRMAVPNFKKRVSQVELLSQVEMLSQVESHESGGVGSTWLNISTWLNNSTATPK